MCKLPPAPCHSHRRAPRKTLPVANCRSGSLQNHAGMLPGELACRRRLAEWILLYSSDEERVKEWRGGGTPLRTH